MPFKFDEDHMGGRGTLKEYFSQETWAGGAETDAKVAEVLGQELADEVDERNNAIDRLQLQLFTEFVGLTGDEPCEVIWPETGYYDEEGYRESKRRLRNVRRRKRGLILVGWQFDDPIMALYKDGVPLAGFYASYRGIYQAGGYVHAGPKAGHYFAHDFLKDLPKNKWLEHEAVCSEIARDFLLNKRER